MHETKTKIDTETFQLKICIKDTCEQTQKYNKTIGLNEFINDITTEIRVNFDDSVPKPYNS